MADRSAPRCGSSAPAAIRAKRGGEEERLFAVWQRAVRATHDFLSTADFEAIAGLVRHSYLPNAELWVAADAGDAAIAFIGLTGAKIDALFVDPDWHGRGVGRLLVGHARRLHAVLNVDVNEQNGGAVAFYQRLGFARAGRSATDDRGRPYPLLHLELDPRS